MHRLKLRSGLISAASILAFPASAAGAAVTCRVDAVEAMQLARQVGFTFRVAASTATRCELINSTIIVAAPQARDVTCDFVIFGRESTENGWRLHSFSRSASEQTDVEVSTLDRGWRLAIAAPKGQTSRVNIKKISLRGEKCENWRQAFAGD